MSPYAPAKHTVLVLGSLQNATLSTTRLLGKAGHRVIVSRDSSRPTSGVRSRYCAEIWDCPLIRHTDTAFIDALVAFLSARPDIEAVFPIGDMELLILARHRAALPAPVRVIMPDPAVIETCHNKVELMRLASRNGVSQTPYALVGGIDELVQEAGRVGYPCVVKPANSEQPLFEQKALIFSNPQQLRAAFRSWPAEHQHLIVQRFAEGERCDIYMLVRAGRILCALQAKILRTQQSDGAGLTVDAITVPLSARLYGECERLMAALDYTGIGYVQFHYDQAHDRPCLLEINPRLGVNYTFTADRGLDLPNLALRLAFDEPMPELEVPFSYPIGSRYVWTYGDLTGLLRELRRGEVGMLQAAAWLVRIPVTALRADRHITWSLTDPMPAVAIYAVLLRRWIARLSRRA